MPFVYLFVLSYALLALYVSSTFKLLSLPSLIEFPTQVSVIVPFRNEALNIKKCLDALKQQTGVDMELILVDDHSDDLSFDIAVVESANLNARVLKSQGSGKKAALLTGISNAKNNIIWTTDADCFLSPGTLESMLRHFHFKQLNMLCGLVQLESNGHLFGDFQQAESAALVGLSAVFLNNERPTTCNGANLMFRKDVFYKIGGYGDDAKTSSGDDDLLMHRFAELELSKVCYHFSPGYMVSTQPESNWKAFISQRARWASKHKRYKYPYNQILLVMMASRIFFYFFLLLLSVVFVSPWLYVPFLILVLSDLVMALKIRQILDFRIYIVPFLPFYQLYIPFAWLKGLFGKTTWKGREITISNEKI
jgi:glycosyltransferase involved in cell wall biosynthesis